MFSFGINLYNGQYNQALVVQLSIISKRELKENEPKASKQLNKELRKNNLRLRIDRSHPLKLLAAIRTTLNNEAQLSKLLCADDDQIDLAKKLAYAQL